MNRHCNPTLSRIMLAALTASFALAAGAANRCDRPQPGGETRACAAAQNGPDSLRRFVERTRMIYALNIADFGSALPANVAVARPHVEAAVVANAR